MYSSVAGKREQHQFVEWYQHLKKRSPHFTYSFDFLTELLCELDARKRIWETFWMINKSQRWMDDLDHLIKMKVDIKDIIHKQLHLVLNDGSYQDLLDIKNSLSQWLHDDFELVNKVDLFSSNGKVSIFDENGTRRPYSVQGSQRHVAEYRLHINREYFSMICSYFEKFVSLDERIMQITETDDTIHVSYDPLLLIQQENWDPSESGTLKKHSTTIV